MDEQQNVNRSDYCRVPKWTAYLEFEMKWFDLGRRAAAFSQQGRLTSKCGPMCLLHRLNQTDTQTQIYCSLNARSTLATLHS